MNEKQEIGGILYERVPSKTGACKGCAFYNAQSELPCQLIDNKASCYTPSLAIFVKAEVDEQCGVGNG